MPPMHVLDYLSDPNCTRAPEDAIRVDYHLLCSGTIYRDVIGEWYKSEIARFLLAPPLVLYAASRPLDTYPVEMVLRLTVAEVTETIQGRGGMTTMPIYHPDSEVAHDMAALLTLLCRRLITISGQANQRRAHDDYPVFGYLPLPVATSMRKVYWPPHSATVITHRDGQEIHDNNPMPLPVAPGTLSALLLGLPRLEQRESIVASARLYAKALELIRQEPDIAYQLLISAVETLANAALQTFQANDDEKVEHQRAVFDLAMELGLAPETARKLALAACKREFWAGKKFKKFLMDRLDGWNWDSDDDLYRARYEQWREVWPRREDLRKSLTKIYSIRSKATHEGHRFPASASYSGGPAIPFHVANSLFWSQSAFPPVMWFERIVNKAIRTYWEQSVRALPSAPAGPAPAEVAEAPASASKAPAPVTPS